VDIVSTAEAERRRVMASRPYLRASLRGERRGGSDLPIPGFGGTGGADGMGFDVSDFIGGGAEYDTDDDTDMLRGGGGGGGAGGR